MSKEVDFLMPRDMSCMTDHLPLTQSDYWNTSPLADEFITPSKGISPCAYALRSAIIFVSSKQLSRYKQEPENEDSTTGEGISLGLHLLYWLLDHHIFTFMFSSFIVIRNQQVGFLAGEPF